MATRNTRNQVPCNGCTLCCQGNAVRLEPGDPAGDYLTEPHPFIPGALMSAHKPNGECVYLAGGGCTIHDRAPSLCRIADCRTIARKYDFETARGLHTMHLIDIRVWDHGCLLLEEEQNGGE
ncbi:MAG: YkgJ family cysteine cluster protein [Bacteroidota bacterium]